MIHPCQNVQKEQSPEFDEIVKESQPAQRLLVCFLIEVKRRNKAKTGLLLGGSTEYSCQREKKKVPNSHLLPTLPPLRIVPKLRRKSNIVWNEMRLLMVEEMLMEPSSWGQRPLSHFPSRLTHVPESVLPGRGSLTRDRSIY